MDKSELFFHFAHIAEDGKPRLSYGDNRLIQVGKTLTVEDEPALCFYGLHASRMCMYALAYASHPYLLTLVTLGGTTIHSQDKSVAQKRTVHAMMSQEETQRFLRDYQQHIFLDVVPFWVGNESALTDTIMHNDKKAKEVVVAELRELRHDPRRYFAHKPLVDAMCAILFRFEDRDIGYSDITNAVAYISKLRYDSVDWYPYNQRMNDMALARLLPKMGEVDHVKKK